MGEVDNELRMGWASCALDAFGAQTGQSGYDYSDGEDLGEIAGDLIGDLLHLARGAGMPARELFDRAWDHFEDEVFEEEHVRPRLDRTNSPDDTDSPDDTEGTGGIDTGGAPDADRTDRPRGHADHGDHGDHGGSGGGPRIEAVMYRDPDESTELTVFLDGVEVEVWEWDFDPGAGHLRSDIEEMRGYMREDPDLSPAMRALCETYYARELDSPYTTDH